MIKRRKMRCPKCNAKMSDQKNIVTTIDLARDIFNVEPVATVKCECGCTYTVKRMIRTSVRCEGTSEP